LTDYLLYLTLISNNFTITIIVKIKQINLKGSIMPKKDKPLPKSPSTPFRKKRSFEEDGKEPLMADQMAMAMAEGKLDDFMKEELPDNEHARKLAEMMMGMTGMMPSGFSGTPTPEKSARAPETETAGTDEDEPAVTPPDDVVNAVKGADVNGLMQLLKREHRKRHGDEAEPVEESNKDAHTSQPQASIEKDILEQMFNIAKDNNLSLDWIFFRALKRYVQEYKKTGNL
jgi:hypothetical protein